MIFPMFIPIFLREIFIKEEKPKSSGYHLHGRVGKIQPYMNENFSLKLKLLGVTSNIQILPKDIPSFLIDKDFDLTYGGRVMLPMMSDGRFDSLREAIELDDISSNTMCSLRTFGYQSTSDIVNILNSSDKKIFLMEFDIENEHRFRAYFTDTKHYSNAQ